LARRQVVLLGLLEQLRDFLLPRFPRITGRRKRLSNDGSAGPSFAESQNPVFRITGAVPQDRNSGGQLRQFHGVNYPRIIREIQQQSNNADYGSEGLGFDHLHVSALAGRKPFSWSPAEAGIIPTAAEGREPWWFGKPGRAAVCF
jgi:hypothetical protein